MPKKYNKSGVSQEDYFPDIDNPPRESIAKGESEEENGDDELIQGERIFEMDLVLKLKPQDGKSVNIPLATGKLRGLLVESVVKHAIKDRRNMTIIRAVLDNPSQREGVQLSINEKKDLL